MRQFCRPSPLGALMADDDALSSEFGRPVTHLWPAANTPGSSRVILTTVFLDFLKKQGYAMRQGLRHLMFRGA